MTKLNHRIAARGTCADERQRSKQNAAATDATHHGNPRGVRAGVAKRLSAGREIDVG
jgi:hypothetical protein